ncbi:cobalamin biosynthesis protein CobD [Pseudodesulfovibrio sp. JC047]|uniref:adenosylcobinamide-phosphate synthase CbiB n=1 Tax=Pseudodesulfovibrio sp. JC047 TaxID=2683199 RepID=UPI0013D74C6E|nr:adenosylcobinamide-phosphate synthase CbiB [Pseudodesulfovibrio sp. JC047]NDV19171.1 cobalamin biosynthesis protein CobD [Pseudodesulfovibrio sp. JC047]
MTTYALIFIIPTLAVMLDTLFGDPKHLPHPVRLIGAGLEWCEKTIRASGLDLRLAGWLTVFLFAAGVWGLVELLMNIPYLGVLIGLYLAYAGLARGCLIRESRKALSLIESNNLDAARTAVSMLVSRDTRNLDAEALRQTLAETVSENLNDGFVAPLFYLCLLGPGGLWAYKTVSTMDSMWGYRTERFNDLGQGAAKTDDILAWIPARITAYLMLIAAIGRGLDISSAKKQYKNDARKMESPNAGWPMATAAWLLRGHMGGPTVYFGQIKDKPSLGPVGKVWNAAMAQRLITLCDRTGSLAAWVFIPVLGICSLIF